MWPRTTVKNFQCACGWMEGGNFNAWWVTGRKCQIKGQLLIMKRGGHWKSSFHCSFSAFGCFCLFVGYVCLMFVIQWSCTAELVPAMERFHSSIAVNADPWAWQWLNLEILWCGKMVAMHAMTVMSLWDRWWGWSDTK